MGMGRRGDGMERRETGEEGVTITVSPLLPVPVSPRL
jgi:hypothetical protein